MANWGSVDQVQQEILALINILSLLDGDFHRGDQNNDNEHSS